MPSYKKNTKFDSTQFPHVHGNRQRFIKRPSVSELFNKLSRQFDLAIWSSAQHKNAEELVNGIFGNNHNINIKFIYGQEKCTGIDRPGTYPLFKKDLRKVFEVFDNVWTKNNTIICDDSDDKFDDNELVKNVIILERFKCDEYSKSMVKQQDEFFEKLINLESETDGKLTAQELLQRVFKGKKKCVFSLFLLSSI